MTYYEIYHLNGAYQIWKWDGLTGTGTRFKSYKTRKGAENWAAKQWNRVIWR